jgi:hypothetical protein
VEQQTFMRSSVTLFATIFCKSKLKLLWKQVRKNERKSLFYPQSFFTFIISLLSSWNNINPDFSQHEACLVMLIYIGYTIKKLLMQFYFFRTRTKWNITEWNASSQNISTFRLNLIRRVLEITSRKKYIKSERELCESTQIVYHFHPLHFSLLLYVSLLLSVLVYVFIKSCSFSSQKRLKINWWSNNEKKFFIFQTLT